jgi:hypothetical protein
MSASSWDEAVPVSASPAVPVATTRWKFATRVAFRFAFSYLVLYNFPFPLNMIWDRALGYEAMWETIVKAVAKQFFGITIVIAIPGSGDTTYDYFKILCLFVVACVATLIWSILDRRRLEYARLYEWLRVYIRFSLACTMFLYGTAKIIPAQFVAPGLDRLLQSFGDASPMGLLWTFMGASTGYTIFTGAGEMLGGLLLTFRRTTLLGALVTIAVMSNVVALNFFYDVPVKLFSVHLLAMALFLVLPDAKRLAQTFFLHRPADVVQGKWLRIAGIVLRTALVVLVIVKGLQFSIEARTYNNARSPMRGIWNVDTLVIDGVNRPPLITDDTRWRRIVIDQPDVIAIYPMVGRRKRFGLALDEKKGVLQLIKADDSKWTFTIHRPVPTTMVMDGTFDGRNYHAILRKSDEDASFRLTTRGFHWINELPFNR